MTIPPLSYAQKNCIAVADTLVSMFARIGFMSSAEINDVVLLLDHARTKSGSDLECDAYDSMLDMLRALRAQAVDFERERIISPKNALP